MSQKSSVRRSLRNLRHIKTWQLVILLALAGFLAATFLRLNNIGMIQRRDAVLAADQAGDVNDMHNRLLDLQQYVSGHMNASTGPFYLEYQYGRDVQKAIASAGNSSNPNGNIHAKADAVCRPQFSSWSLAYVQCFTEELAKYPPSPDPSQNVDLPSAQLYRYDFVSPRWSADFAGWSVLLCAVLLVIILMRIVSYGILSLVLKIRFKDI